MLVIGRNTHCHQKSMISGYMKPDLDGKKKVSKDRFCGKSQSNLGVDPTWGGMVTWLDILALFLIASMTTSKAIKREPQREATGTTVALTPTGHSTANSGGGASKKLAGVTSPIFQPARSAKRHQNRVIDPNTGGYSQDLASCIGVAIPRAAFEGSLRPPKRH